MKMYRIFWSLVTTIQIFSAIAFGDEASDLLIKRSELQRQRDQIKSIDDRVNQVSRDWQRISHDFQNQAVSLQSSLGELKRISTAQKSDMEEISKWLSGNYPVVLAAQNSADFRQLMENYRLFRGNKKGCDSNSIGSTYADALGYLHTMYKIKEDAVALNRSWNLPPTYDEVKNSLSSSSTALITSYENAEKSIGGYNKLLNTSNICKKFLSFDLVISLSQTIFEANKASAAIDAIDIKSFLNEINTQEKERNLLKQARRLATSLEGRNIVNIRLGRLSETLNFSSNYSKQIDIMEESINTLKALSDSEKKQALVTLNESRVRLAKELSDSKVIEEDGKRSFLLTRSRNVQNRLFKISSMNLDENKSKNYQTVKTFCQNELNMTPTGRYILPQKNSFDQSLKLDAKFAKAQEMLSLIDEGGE